MPLTLNGTTGIAGVDGSAGTPAARGSDTDTGVFFPSAGIAAVATNGTEAFRADTNQNLLVGVTSANANGGVLQLKSGITFPATQVSATDANTLDDYEEGTWTPTIAPLSGSLTSYTASGSYTKIGNLVSLRCIFTIVNAGTASSVAIISNIPAGIGPGATNNSAGVMRENAVSGISGGLAPVSSTQIYAAKYDGGTPFVTGYAWLCEITYPVS
jgi:hypothetical protein